MLEPLAADVLKNGVEGDFLEAGVASGGISVFMAATLRAAGALGDARPGARTMWVADSFRGLPPPEEYIHGFAGTRRTAAAGTLPGISKKSLLGIHSRDRKARIWHGGEFTGSVPVVAGNFNSKLLPLGAGPTPPLRTSPSCSVCPAGLALPEGVQFLEGFFNDSLPVAPVGKLAMLRADSDLYTSIFETLHVLYPRLSVGGYVVFDDWPIAQARDAIIHYRKEHDITTPIVCAGPQAPPPFQVAHLLSFWKKDAVTG